MCYSFLRKKTKLPVDFSEAELGFSDEENEQLATQQGESEDDRDSENDEDYEPVNEDSRDSEERRRSEDRSYTWPDSVSTCDTFLEKGIVQASAGNSLMLTLYR
ncbi:hypothetical protein CRENBAI_002713 [Crenichthys baileyi]|uniref:Uncharacterized protein n=1 Tax=Crenichthys baileyi TaxID=28760 RepID=A0AAV9RNU5_9TELE